MFFKRGRDGRDAGRPRGCPLALSPASWRERAA